MSGPRQYPETLAETRAAFVEAETDLLVALEGLDHARAVYRQRLEQLTSVLSHYAVVLCDVKNMPIGAS